MDNELREILINVMKKSKRLLIVDDDKIDRMSIKRQVKKLHLDIEIIEQKNGKEALDFLLAADTVLPDLILLDLNMPKMSGWVFLQHLKESELNEQIPVVILTTSNNPQDIEKIALYKDLIKKYIIKMAGFENTELFCNELKLWLS